MAKKKGKKELPIVALNNEEREEVWDDLLIKEEGIVLEFDPGSNTGKIKSLQDRLYCCLRNCLSVGRNIALNMVLTIMEARIAR